MHPIRHHQLAPLFFPCPLTPITATFSRLYGERHIMFGIKTAPAPKREADLIKYLLVQDVFSMFIIGLFQAFTMCFALYPYDPKKKIITKHIKGIIKPSRILDKPAIYPIKTGHIAPPTIAITR